MIFCMTVHLIEIQQKYLQERKKKSNSVTSSRMYTVNVTMFLQVAGKDQASTVISGRLPAGNLLILH